MFKKVNVIWIKDRPTESTIPLGQNKATKQRKLLVTLEMKVEWERKERQRMICQKSMSQCPSFWLSRQQTFQSVGTWQFGCFPFPLLSGHNRSQYYIREWSKSCFMAPIKASLNIFRTQLDSWVLHNTLIQEVLGQTMKQ